MKHHFVMRSRGSHLISCGGPPLARAGSVPVASAAEVASGRRDVRRASNALFRGFWSPSGREATMESLRAALALKGKGKDVADGPGAGERGATTGDQV